MCAQLPVDYLFNYANIILYYIRVQIAFYIFFYIYSHWSAKGFATRSDKNK